MKKYEFTGETKLLFEITLHRIRAAVSFGAVVKGEIGGWIEKESNLDVDGNAWVYGNAMVYGDAMVSGNARVSGDAHCMVVGPIGSRNDTVTFTRDKGGSIYAKIGCFFGTIADFRAKVRETHGDNNHAKAYLLAADLAEIRIDTTPIEGETEVDNAETE